MQLKTHIRIRTWSPNTRRIVRQIREAASVAIDRACIFPQPAPKGQSAVEFAIISGLFLFLLFAVMDYSWIFFAQLNVQQAVDDGGRFTSTGNHLPKKSGGNESRIQSIIDTIQNEISVPNVDVSKNLSICSVQGGCNTSGGAAPAGNPGDTVTLRLTTSLPMWTPLLSTFFAGGAYTFTASTSFKNEPFDPGNTN